ncbi:hypothetical protein [Carboxylicivirga taeanensis]|uniref:hypothetical protein n=1 Tax=Carboxylicivirga taeanensis TaxID=1416875 RepID=UPI003F6E1644
MLVTNIGTLVEKQPLIVTTIDCNANSATTKPNSTSLDNEEFKHSQKKMAISLIPHNNEAYLIIFFIKNPGDRLKDIHQHGF